MKCGEVRTFMSQVTFRQEPIAAIPAADFDFLTANGYVLPSSQDDYSKGLAEVTRLSSMVDEAHAEEDKVEQERRAVQKDQSKERSILMRFEGQEKARVAARIPTETAELTEEESALGVMEANVNQLIQEKSILDRMVPFGAGYVSLTDLGAVIYDDLSVRDYRVEDEEFPDFLAEIKATYAELRAIADKATYYVSVLSPNVPISGRKDAIFIDASQSVTKARSEVWSIAIGLAKLQGDPNQIGDRFGLALHELDDVTSIVPSRLMAAETMTALSGQDVQSLASTIKDLNRQVTSLHVPKELSIGVAATMLAGRQFGGIYPVDRFSQYKEVTNSFEAASILAVMNLPFDDLSAKFRGFRIMFSDWGYMTSEDTEIASAFLAIGELAMNEVEEKLKYIIEQLKNYLEYPLVAAAILASIPVFEAHEVLDLMEKAVTLLSAYASGLERSELVALAVRMIHGVRNEIVKEIDPTAKITETPVQFTYGPHPAFFIRFYPVLVAHSSYNATFSGMGGFHPAHSHGIGGFAG